MESGIKLSALCAASALFVAPLPDFEEVRRTKRVGERTVFPFVCMWANSFMWITYGLYIGDIFPTVMTNSLGLLFSTYYCAIFAWAVGESPSQKAKAYSMFSAALFIVGALCMLCFGGLYAKPMMGIETDTSEDDRVQKWAGLAASGSTVVQYASPLALLVKVVRRQSTEGLSGRVAVVSLICGSLWLLYGTVTNNPFLYVPNMLGVMAALAQCCLFLIYPRRGRDAGKKSPAKIKRKDSSATNAWRSSPPRPKRAPGSPAPRGGGRSPKARDSGGKGHRDHDSTV